MVAILDEAATGLLDESLAQLYDEAAGLLDEAGTWLLDELLADLYGG